MPWPLVCWSNSCLCKESNNDDDDDDDDDDDNNLIQSELHESFVLVQSWITQQV